MTLQPGRCVFDSSNQTFQGAGCPAQPPTVGPPVGGFVVVPATNLFISTQSELRVVGNFPVIFAVYGSALLDGRLDASAEASTPGPGAAVAPCTLGQGTDAVGTQTNLNGGGGGGFGSPGGDSDGAGPSGSPGGSTEGDASLVPLRAGCRGGNVQSATMGGRVSEGGGAGGAIQISAANAVIINGTLSVSGGGGEGGRGLSAGAGGGSGGAVLIEALVLELEASAAITANGGSGGAGGDGAFPGQDGEDGALDSAQPAQGGQGPLGGGGDGAAGTIPAEDGGPSVISAGGGGGGVGRIRLTSPACTVNPISTVSPPAVGC